MKSLHSWLRNKTTWGYLFATIIPFIISVALISVDSIRLGFVFLSIPIVVLCLFHKDTRIFLILFTFFFQMYWIPLSFYIRIFITDFVFLFFLIHFLFDQFKIRKNLFQDSNVVLNELLYPYILFFCFCVFSTLLNIYRFNEQMLLISIWYNLRCLQLIIAILILSKLKFTILTIEKIYDLIIICGLLQFPVGLLQLRSTSDITGTLTEHHSCLSAMITIVILLTIYKCFIWLKRKNYSRVLYYFIASVLNIYTLYGTGSRSALLGLFVSLGVYILAIFLTKQLKVSLITIAVIIAIGYISLKYTPLKDVINRSLNSSDSVSKIDISSLSRLLIWKYTWISFTKFPIITKLFGIGIGTFAFLKQHFVLWNGNQSFTGAHLNPLHVLVETGAIGLIIFSSVFIATLIVFFKSRKHVISKVGFYSSIALLFSGISQETFWFQSSFGTLWLFYIFTMCLILTHIKIEEKQAIG